MHVWLKDFLCNNVLIFTTNPLRKQVLIFFPFYIWKKKLNQRKLRNLTKVKENPGSKSIVLQKRIIKNKKIK